MPPLPRDVDELKRRILEAAASVTAEMFGRVWQDMEYKIDVCHVTKGHTPRASQFLYLTRSISLYLLMAIPV